VQKDSALAKFIRNRRAQLQPTDVGLPHGARRRVKGLRREEVAALAGVSVEYYLRIEQGRETNPSDQVLDAIARALMLDADTTAYLRDLVPRCANRRVLKDLNPAIQSLIESWPNTAAHIHDSALNVVAVNPLARKLFPGLGVGVNPLRSLFLDPETRNFYQDWNKVAVWAVRWVRAYAAHNPDPGLAAVIDELLATPGRFRELWSCPDVRHDNSGKVKIVHPDVGPLTLQFQHMTLGSGHALVVYWAEPGSPAEDIVRRLSAA
jgi:transcriptional regulator with XRE-family HTH domain